jgi:hypothetical protein
LDVGVGENKKILLAAEDASLPSFGKVEWRQGKEPLQQFFSIRSHGKILNPRSKIKPDGGIPYFTPGQIVMAEFIEVMLAWITQLDTNLTDMRKGIAEEANRSEANEVSTGTLQGNPLAKSAACGTGWHESRLSGINSWRQ